MRLLYLSCHSTQEYQELSIFQELGVSFFSVGSYLDPENPTESLRPPISLRVNPDLLAKFKLLNPSYKFMDKVKLTKEFVDHFDVVMVSHFSHYFENLENFKHKPIIFAPVGQSTPGLEGFLLKVKDVCDLKIQRVSLAEEALTPYAGTDLVVRPIVDSTEFSGWTGEEEAVLTVNKWITRGGGAVCSFNEYCAITKNLPRSLYGQGNGDVEFSKGELNYQELKSAYQNHRVFLSMGTKPAPFTYTFMEALMTGCPVVTLGPLRGNSSYAKTYEAYKFIENGVDGFWSDDVTELRYHLLSLLNDKDLADKISAKGRMKALSLFDRSVAERTWRDFFNENYGAGL